MRRLRVEGDGLHGSAPTFMAPPTRSYIVTGCSTAKLRRKIVFAFSSPLRYSPPAVFNRCVMLSSLFVAVSCVSHSAHRHCPECERLQADFLEARNRLRNLSRLRKLSALEEKQLVDRVAMAIARAKEHEAGHNVASCKKGIAAG